MFSLSSSGSEVSLFLLVKCGAVPLDGKAGREIWPGSRLPCSVRTRAIYIFAFLNLTFLCPEIFLWASAFWKAVSCKGTERFPVFLLWFDHVYETASHLNPGVWDLITRLTCCSNAPSALELHRVLPPQIMLPPMSPFMSCSESLQFKGSDLWS